MDLEEYYFSNIQPKEYHHKFYASIKMLNEAHDVSSTMDELNDCSFEIFDQEEAIDKFRDLCQPEVTFDERTKCWFYLITYYLHKSGYEIKEFPRILARPPVDPSDFTYNDIRNKIISQGGDDHGTVRYATRRSFVSEFHFELKNTHIDIIDSLNQKFMEISNRQASFDNMSIDEKLSELANLIENFLKKNGKFITLDYSKISFDYISNDIVCSYRKRLHCFRHATQEAMAERSSYSEEQKKFLIDYGLIIIKIIYFLVNKTY